MKRSRILPLLALGILAFASCDPSGGGSPPPEPYDQLVKVLRCAGGAPVASATVEIRATDGTLVDSGTTDASGDARLSIGAAGTFIVSATKDGHAQSRYQGPLEPGAWLDLYTYELGMVAYPALAPSLDTLEYFDGIDWIPYTPGMSVTSAELQLLRATFSSYASLERTADSGLGITLSLDSGRTNQTYGYEETALPPTTVIEASGTPLRTTATWDMADPGIELPSGEYTLGFLAYDWANNRLEAAYPFSGADDITDDPSLAAIVPVIESVEGRTWGVENTVFSRDEDPRAASYHEGIPSSSSIALGFTIADGTETPVGARAVEIWRSANGGAAALVGEMIAGGLISRYEYEFRDMDARLVPGVEYTYTIRARNASGSSLMSAPKSLILLPPHHLTLSSPANGAISSSISPLLRFKVSTPSLLASTDYYTFNVQIKDMAGSVVYDEDVYYSSWDQAFFFYDNDAEAPEYSLSPATGTITLNLSLAAVELAPNASYQWNILWESNGPYFLRYYEDDGCVARGYSTNYDAGYDADNGWFTLSIAANAN